MYTAYVMESVARERMDQAQRAASRSAGRRSDARPVRRRRNRVATAFGRPLRDRLA